MQLHRFDPGQTGWQTHRKSAMGCFYLLSTVRYPIQIPNSFFFFFKEVNSATPDPSHHPKKS